MKPKLLTAFGMELKAQALAAVAELNAMEMEMAEGAGPRREMVEELEALHMTGVRDPPPHLGRAMKHETGRVLRILTRLQSALAAAGVVSMILWPSERGSSQDVKRRRQRGQELRRMLGIGDDSPLRVQHHRSNDARGGLLHVDEMLEDYLDRHPGREVRPLSIGVLESAEGWNPDGAVRTLDEETLILRVNGRTCDLKVLKQALWELASKVTVNARVSVVRYRRVGVGSGGSSVHFVAGRGAG